SIEPDIGSDQHFLQSFEEILVHSAVPCHQFIDFILEFLTALLETRFEFIADLFLFPFLEFLDADQAVIEFLILFLHRLFGGLFLLVRMESVFHTFKKAHTVSSSLTFSSSFLRSTLMSWLTPRSCIVTPNSRSLSSIVPFLWVMTMNCVFSASCFKYFA